MSLIETLQEREAEVNKQMGDIPDESACKKYHSTMLDSLKAKIDKHKKQQKVLRKQYLDTLVEDKEKDVKK